MFKENDPHPLATPAPEKNFEAQGSGFLKTTLFSAPGKVRMD